MIRVEIGMVRIRSSPLKSGIVEAKLSKACTIANAENEYSRKNLMINVMLPYQIPFHSEMVGAHLLGCRRAAGIAKHLL
jgi:hypothetical protein